jgi:hypothetical protein
MKIDLIIQEKIKKIFSLFVVINIDIIPIICRHRIYQTLLFELSEEKEDIIAYKD